MSADQTLCLTAEGERLLEQAERRGLAGELTQTLQASDNPELLIAMVSLAMDVGQRAQRHMRIICANRLRTRAADYASRADRAAVEMYAASQQGRHQEAKMQSCVAAEARSIADILVQAAIEIERATEDDDAGQEAPGTEAAPAKADADGDAPAVAGETPLVIIGQGDSRRVIEDGPHGLSERHDPQ